MNFSYLDNLHFNKIQDIYLYNTYLESKYITELGHHILSKLNVKIYFITNKKINNNLELDINHNNFCVYDNFKHERIYSYDNMDKIRKLLQIIINNKNAIELLYHNPWYSGRCKEEFLLITPNFYDIKNIRRSGLRIFL